MAKEYGVDPWTVAFEWEHYRFDFNLAITNRALDFIERETKKRNMGKRGR